MAVWKEAILALAKVIENPFVKNGYEELKKYYKNNNLTEQAEALQFLIDKRFNDPKNTDIDQKQPEDNSKDA